MMFIDNDTPLWIAEVDEARRKRMIEPIDGMNSAEAIRGNKALYHEYLREKCRSAPTANGKRCSEADEAWLRATYRPEAVASLLYYDVPALRKAREENDRFIANEQNHSPAIDEAHSVDAEITSKSAPAEIEAATVETADFGQREDSFDENSLLNNESLTPPLNEAPAPALPQGTCEERTFREEALRSVRQGPPFKKRRGLSHVRQVAKTVATLTRSPPAGNPPANPPAPQTSTAEAPPVAGRPRKFAAISDHVIPLPGESKSKHRLLRDGVFEEFTPQLLSEQLFCDDVTYAARQIDRYRSRKEQRYLKIMKRKFYAAISRHEELTPKRKRKLWRNDARPRPGWNV